MLNLIEVILTATGAVTWVFIFLWLCGALKVNANIERK